VVIGHGATSVRASSFLLQAFAAIAAGDRHALRRLIAAGR
jgi:hypothetical protein